LTFETLNCQKAKKLKISNTQIYQMKKEMCEQAVCISFLLCKLNLWAEVEEKEQFGARGHPRIPRWHNIIIWQIFKHISFYLTATPTSSQIVAFTAVLTHPVSLGPLQTIEYDNVITNIGNAYETRDGQFSAPVSGVYLISATVYTTGNSVFTEIVKNGKQLAAMYGDHNDHSWAVWFQLS
jgi:hypothetical protein